VRRGNIDDARNHSIELFRVQAAELFEHPEQEEAFRPAGDQEVLPLLPEAYAAQGSEIGDSETGE
jgi:hypothetical protein